MLTQYWLKMLHPTLHSSLIRPIYISITSSHMNSRNTINFSSCICWLEIHVQTTWIAIGTFFYITMTLSHLIVELWRIWSTCSLPLLLGSFWSRVVDSSMDQIELFNHLIMCKQITDVKLNCECYIAICVTINFVQIKLLDSNT